MLRSTFARLAFLAPLLAWPVGPTGAQAPDTPGAGAPAPTPKVDAVGSLAGQLLVAAPGMPDDRFDGTVILMIRHDKGGAFGIVINRPVEDHPIAELLDSIGEPDQTAEGSVSVFAGGPVQPEVGFILHSAEYRQPNTVAVAPGIALTSSGAILRDIGHHRGPSKVRVAFGYAGWSAGQLEHEMELHAWGTTAADPKLVFDTDPERLWDLAWARRAVDL